MNIKTLGSEGISKMSTLIIFVKFTHYKFYKIQINISSLTVKPITNSPQKYFIAPRRNNHKHKKSIKNKSFKFKTLHIKTEIKLGCS